LHDISDRILKRIGNSENVSRSVFLAVPIDFAAISSFCKPGCVVSPYGLRGGGGANGEERNFGVLMGSLLNCREAQVFCNGFRSIRAYRDQEITVCQSPCFPVGCRTLSAQVRINSTKVRFQRLMKYGLKQTSGVINASQS